MSQTSIHGTFVKRAAHELGALWVFSTLALAAAACSATADAEGDVYEEESDVLVEQELTLEEATRDVEDRAAENTDKSLKRPVSSSEHPDASCEAAPVFGNVICVECTTGPFPTCTTYVCDKQGNNCKQTSRRFSANLEAVLPNATLSP
jgi:hypothetical protein